MARKNAEPSAAASEAPETAGPVIFDNTDAVEAAEAPAREETVELSGGLTQVNYY